MPLHFTARNNLPQHENREERIKEEEEEGTVGLPPIIGEADDEDEDDERNFSFRDSGIGTSIEDTGRGARRRRGSGYMDARGL